MNRPGAVQSEAAVTIAGMSEQVMLDVICVLPSSRSFVKGLDDHRETLASPARHAVGRRHKAEHPLARTSVESAPYEVSDASATVASSPMGLAPVGNSENLGLLPNGVLARMLDRHDRHDAEFGFGD
jgi:hypothetical protein